MNYSSDMTSYNDIADTPNFEDFQLKDNLPELDDRQIRHAHAPEQVSWAYRQLAQGVGHVWNMPDIGISMQVVSEKSIGVLSVINHKFPLLILACIRTTLEHLGLSLRIDEAIIIPFVDSSPEEKTKRTTQEPEESFIEVV